ncbi:hypothetical protein KAR91_16135 [Candidatus Pacearchaeota archaeon]|nr:hypothetical protein [Candidatus Pacearchaeota archaeon]
MVVCATPISAQDYWVDHTDDVTDADTSAVRSDTLFSPSFDIRYGRMFRFAVDVGASPLGLDTNFVNDSLFVFLQVSPDRIRWRTLLAGGTVVGLDTIALTAKAADSAVFPVDTLADMFYKVQADSVLGNWGRFMFIYEDELDDDDIGGNTYYRRYTGWIFPKKDAESR